MDNSTILTEVQFLELTSATNIFSSCLVEHQGSVYLLVAAQRQVHCVNVTSQGGTNSWISTPLTLANLNGFEKK